MSFTNFRFQVVARILLILALGYSAVFVLVNTPFSLLVFWLVLFAIILLVDLIRYVEKANKDLSNFLMAIQQNDFSNVYPEKRRRTRNLYQVFNIITREFIKIRSEKESNFHFFKTVVEHSKVPLLAYEMDSLQVTLINEAAKELLHVPYLSKANALTKVNEELANTILHLSSDERVLLKTEIGGETYQLSIIAKVLVLQKQAYKVIALHNIHAELDQQEIESWQKLIRVLTHEIKNSVIPISTLTEVINQMMVYPDGSSRVISDLDDEEEQDLKMSLRTIEKRSKGLVKFVNSYGDLARMPQPELEDTDLCALVAQIVELEQEHLQTQGVAIVQQFEKGPVLVRIDASMIEQVVINLIKNAMEALHGAEQPTIEIVLRKTPDEVLLSIKDNGPGIDKETLSNIFVPFYTTKKEGSGIGLPLSRQFMRAHGGRIRAHSEVGGGASFELAFRL